MKHLTLVQKDYIGRFTVVIKEQVLEICLYPILTETKKGISIGVICEDTELLKTLTDEMRKELSMSFSVLSGASINLNKPIETFRVNTEHGSQNVDMFDIDIYGDPKTFLVGE